MKPLKTTQRILVWLGMCPIGACPTSRKRNRIACYIFACTIFCVNLTSMITQSAFFLKFMMTNLKESLLGLMGGIANIGIIYAMISAYRLRPRIGKIFTDLSVIYRESEYFLFSSRNWHTFHQLFDSYYFNLTWISDNNSELIGFLTRANSKCEWLWKIYFLYMLIGCVNTIMLSGTSVLLCWLINGNLQVDHFYHSLNFM